MVDKKICYCGAKNFGSFAANVFHLLIKFSFVTGTYGILILVYSRTWFVFNFKVNLFLLTSQCTRRLRGSGMDKALSSISYEETEINFVFEWKWNESHEWVLLNELEFLNASHLQITGKLMNVHLKIGFKYQIAFICFNLIDLGLIVSWSMFMSISLYSTTS